MSTESRQQQRRKKRKLPKSFLECHSLLQVVDFPSAEKSQEHRLVCSNAVNDVTKEILLGRLVKEIVEPLAPIRSSHSTRFGKSEGSVDPGLEISTPKADSTEMAKSVWKQRIVMGTNQCSRFLEKAMNCSSAPKPLLCVCAKDTYPPTMLAHVPVIATKLKIPLLILGGKASKELGKAFRVKQVSIVLFLPSDKRDPMHEAVDSFCNYALTLVGSL
eukprot:scaffold11589_cov117-Cylindrotheca_fusiformis.AAC.9